MVRLSQTRYTNFASLCFLAPHRLLTSDSFVFRNSLDSPQSSPSSGSQDSLHRHPAGTGTYPGPANAAAAAAAAAAAKKKSRFGTLGRIFKKGDSRAGPQMKLMHPGMAAMQAYPRFHSPSPIPTQGERWKIVVHYTSIPCVRTHNIIQ